MANARLLTKIQRALAQSRYRIRIHVVRHMVEEGFDERDLVKALSAKSKILEDYPDDFRCLVLGYYSIGGTLRSPLHAVVDCSNARRVDVVTPYIPQRPWWETPEKRGQTK